MRDSSQPWLESHQVDSDTALLLKKRYRASAPQNIVAEYGGAASLDSTVVPVVR